MIEDEESRSKEENIPQPKTMLTVLIDCWFELAFVGVHNVGKCP